MKVVFKLLQINQSLRKTGEKFKLIQNLKNNTKLKIQILKNNNWFDQENKRKLGLN